MKIPALTPEQIRSVLGDNGGEHQSAATAPVKRLKYVIVRNFVGLKMALIFHESIPHNAAVDQSWLAPLSAGFFSLTDHGLIVWPGGSDTLGLEPKPDDWMVIQDTLILMGLFPKRSK
ncbi:hypothetical protein [Silvimonas sp.]|uniref:hypothetical protein n=1 Tax=Silvimonas sp. TaxID=2650811 RepID=UPI00284FE01F|nr:hypothetical protein [Silvimonas sp.]MDR3427834.1 hypothetical protein [Silvimonas sp.]